MKAWSHLPNAAHVDQVLRDFNNHPAIFKDAARYVRRNAAWCAAWNEARNAARDLARDAARDAIRDAIRDQVTFFKWDVVTRSCAASRGAVVALIAYDNAGEYMTMLPEQALAWGQLRDDHAYMLLRDYLQIRVRISQQEMTQ
jgi:hypothetical protein